MSVPEHELDEDVSDWDTCEIHETSYLIGDTCMYCGDDEADRQFDIRRDERERA